MNKNAYMRHHSLIGKVIGLYPIVEGSNPSGGSNDFNKLEETSLFLKKTLDATFKSAIIRV